MSADPIIRRLIAVLPSEQSAVTFTRADLRAMVEGDTEATNAPPTRDLTAEEVAEETGRAPSTVRGWLIAGQLRGYKLNGRDWRVPRSALREYLDRQAEPEPEPSPAEVDIGAWRTLRERR
jgi:excisionase family DNA binding protein